MFLEQVNVLLWMGPVNRSIHTHSDPERPQPPVFLDPSEDGHQTCGHQIWGPEGHSGADVLNSDTIFGWGRQTEGLEDDSGVLQTISVPEKWEHL